MLTLEIAQFDRNPYNEQAVKSSDVLGKLQDLFTFKGKSSESQSHQTGEFNKNRKLRN